eukprot:gene9569-12890_t
MTDLKESLLSINRDITLSNSEKEEKRKQLLLLHQQNLSKKKDSLAVQVNDCDFSYHSCAHYPNKKCSSFFFSCCGVFDTCHRCHQESGCEVAPPAIESIKCNECNITQKPSQICVNPNCGTKFNNSYCSLCYIWTEVDVTHCEDCGICRVGLKDQLFHCHQCDCCVGIEYASNHSCFKKVKLREENCPFCLEALFTSQKTITNFICGHFSHLHCWRASMKTGNYRCPLCRKTVADVSRSWDVLRRAIELQPLTDDIIGSIEKDDILLSNYGLFQIMDIKKENNSLEMYDGIFPNWILANGQAVRGSMNTNSVSKPCIYRKIWCNDCEKDCISSFHYLGTECTHCKGFNTRT